MIQSWWQACEALPLTRWARVLFAAVIAWIGLLMVFTLVQSIDMSRLGIEHTLVEVVQAQSVIMLPWLAIFPAIAITRMRQVLLGTPIVIALSELALLSGAAILLVYLHIVFIYAPFLNASPAQTLDQIPLTSWVWDPVMMVLTALLADVHAGPLKRQANQAGETTDRIILRTGSQEDIIDVADIIALSAQGNYVAFISRDREWLHRTTLAELVVQLTQLDFIHVHRSHLVRGSEIASCARERGRVVRLTLRTGQSFPVSARGAELVQAHLAQAASSGLAPKSRR